MISSFVFVGMAKTVFNISVRIGIKNNRTKDNESCVECPLIRTLHLFFFELLHIDLEKYYILP